MDDFFDIVGTQVVRTKWGNIIIDTKGKTPSEIIKAIRQYTPRIIAEEIIGVQPMLRPVKTKKFT